MTVKMFASIPWPAMPVSVNSPSQPVSEPSSCAWESWPSLNSTRTLSQEIPLAVLPSSASATDTRYGIVSPKSATLPFSGISIVTTGRVLPALTVTVSVAESPDSSVTVSRAA